MQVASPWQRHEAIAKNPDRLAEETMKPFIKGLDLCESFFMEIVAPLLRKHYPNLSYSAGLIGYGSDVLGYDDVTSTDHMWGPRFHLFLRESDLSLRKELAVLFAAGFPYEHRGHSVNFSEPDSADPGIRWASNIREGLVSPLYWIHSPEQFIMEYIGIQPRDSFDWLALSENRLLGLTSGKLFIDMLQFNEIRNQYAHYPEDVKLYLIASQWALIGEEQAFAKRCAVRGDEAGSRIICARIIERLMRLCFLYRNKYAPYSKWFGTAFSNLGISDEIRETFCNALCANGAVEREDMLVKAQALVARLHNESGLTDPLPVEIRNYFGRDIKVIHADRISSAVKAKIQDPLLRVSPGIGTFSQIGNCVELYDNPKMVKCIAELYRNTAAAISAPE
jgi:hypothetical protein